MRIIIIIIGFMALLCAGMAWAMKPERFFDRKAVFDQRVGMSILLAQNEGEGNSQRGCGRRDTPPLSS